MESVTAPPRTAPTIAPPTVAPPATPPGVPPPGTSAAPRNLAPAGPGAYSPAGGAGGPDPREHPLVKDVIELFQAKVIDVQRKETGDEPRK